MQETITAACKQVTMTTAKDSVTWKLISGTTTLCSLWNPPVKPVKRQLKYASCVAKVVSTFDELTAALYQIEAYLNSRLLVNLSSNPQDTNR